MGSSVPTSVFPAQLDKRGAGGTLLEAPNRRPGFIPAARLAVGISETELTLKLVGIDLSMVPAQGLVSIGSELIRYTSVNAALNEVYIDNVSLRGYGATEAQSYPIGTKVLWMLTNEHLAAIHAAIEATQARIGVAGSTDPASLEFRLRELAQSVNSGDLTQDAIEMTQEYIDAKSFRLASAVKSPSGVVVFVMNAGAQENGIDYTVSGTSPAVIGWAGLSLDGLLSVGDKLLVVYEAA